MGAISSPVFVLLCWAFHASNIYAKELNRNETPRTFSGCGLVDAISKTDYVLYKRGKFAATTDGKEYDTNFYQKLNKNQKVVFVIHGFKHGCDRDFVQTIKEAYFQSKPDVQVVTVCYRSAEVSVFMFPWTRLTMECVADKTRKIISRVHDEVGIKWDDMTVVGHSFGGQISGEVGNLLNGKLGWIIALDATRFSFKFVPKLTPASAKHVLAVHTDSYPLGMAKSAGTADFYVNGGARQPGCEATWDLMCSHRRSFIIFKNVILNDKFYTGRKCDSYDHYKSGKCKDNESTYLTTEVRATGKFYFDTEGSAPYKQIASMDK